MAFILQKQVVRIELADAVSPCCRQYVLATDEQTNEQTNRQTEAYRHCVKVLALRRGLDNRLVLFRHFIVTD